MVKRLTRKFSTSGRDPGQSLTRPRLRGGFFGLICALLALGVMMLHRNGDGSDPSQDFGFGFVASGGLVGAEQVRWMSQEQIAGILMDRMKPAASVHQVRELAKVLLDLCKSYRFDPAFVLSLIHVESGFQSRVVSPSGAVGLMQLMPASAEVIARRHQISYSGFSALLNPAVSLRLGIAYLWELRERYRERSPYFFVAAYNMGPAKMDELLERGTFRPVLTRKYYREIQRMTPVLWRFPRSSSSGKSTTRSA